MKIIMLSVKKISYTFYFEIAKPYEFYKIKNVILK